MSLPLNEALDDIVKPGRTRRAFSGAMDTPTITLTRIANDFRLLASEPTTGLDEICLPPVQAGSSIMPGKVYPVMTEGGIKGVSTGE